MGGHVSPRRSEEASGASALFIELPEVLPPPGPLHQQVRAVHPQVCGLQRTSSRGLPAEARRAPPVSSHTCRGWLVSPYLSQEGQSKYNCPGRNCNPHPHPRLLLLTHSSLPLSFPLTSAQAILPALLRCLFPAWPLEQWFSAFQLSFATVVNRNVNI